MTKIGKQPPGVFARMDGALPKTDEEKRDKAARFVLGRAKDAEDAMLILEILGIDPQEIGGRTETAEAKLPRSTPRRRFR